MNFDNKLQLLQQQKLVLTPELKQAITILQLPLLDLEPFLIQQVEENPVLEMDMVEKEELSLDGAEKEQTPEEWLEYFNDRSDLGINKNTDSKSLMFERTMAPLPELKDLLREQVLLAFNGQERNFALFLIEHINENGYLTLSDEEALKHLNIPYDLYIALLKKLQQFEPSGVAARNLKECLAIQIEQKGYPKEEEKILFELATKYLEEIAEGRVLKLAQVFNLTPHDMQHFLDTLKTLNPFPGASYSSNTASYIVPDIVVEKVSGQFIIIVNDAAVPRITMSETYLNLINKEKDESVKKYIQQKIHNATWLLKSIEQRRITLYRVANAILEQQNDFFEHGKEYLKPLVLRQIAEIVGLHESTISRAVANKYMQTPNGVFPLKFFFTGGLSTSSGEDKSVSTIKDKLKELISSEDDKQPLSDQKIADLLNAQGINISRRTVAKYREEMQIPSSSKRKRY